MASFHSFAVASSLLLLLLDVHPIRAEFNFEVGQRIHERVSGFMGTPTSILLQIARYRSNAGFPHDLRAPDRNAFFRLNDALMETYPEFQSIYYGLEDGMFAGHGFASKIANYREPGHSGYVIDTSNTAQDSSMQKHYVGCVNATNGNPVECTMKAGGKYTECINDCTLEKCADEASQRNCTDEVLFINEEERTACEENVKWCQQYAIKEAEENVTRGYIVRSTHCIDSQGVPSETFGEIVKKGTNERGNCYFGDTDILVQRNNITGDYAYCGDNGEVCKGTLVGGYISRDYDPRWRGWYIATKALQVPNWSPPYAFYSVDQIGITFSLPIYTMNDNNSGQKKNVFEGVLAVDFTFNDISNFLTTNYKDSSTIVAIFEEAEPHYIVASSTGSTGVKKVRRDNPDVVCSSVDSADDCKAVRISAGELDETDMDSIIRSSFGKVKAERFPHDELLSSTPEGFESVYATQTKLFSIPDAELSWQIMIMIPIATEEDDTIEKGDQLFGVLIAISTLGVLICGALMLSLVKKRRERRVIMSDWRFLSAFICSCALLNLSCLSFLGPNTDALCLLRQWLVHFFFVLALSLLFVKTYRIYKLATAADRMRAASISHAKTVRMALPFVILQTILLLIFTFYDPNKQTELIEINGSDISHRLVCSHETPAFFITTMIYEGGLILAGCVLAFKTRNLQSEFNESKEIILSMYDLAVIATLILVVSNAALSYQGEQRLLFSLGIFWTTCFACCVFVLPRTMKSRQSILAAIAHTASRASRVPRRMGSMDDLPSSTNLRTNGSHAVSGLSKSSIASNPSLTVKQIRARSNRIKYDPNLLSIQDDEPLDDSDSFMDNSKISTSVDLETASTEQQSATSQTPVAPNNKPSNPRVSFATELSSTSSMDDQKASGPSKQEDNLEEKKECPIEQDIPASDVIENEAEEVDLESTGDASEGFSDFLAFLEK